MRLLNKGSGERHWGMCDPNVLRQEWGTRVAVTCSVRHVKTSDQQRPGWLVTHTTWELMLASDWEEETTLSRAPSSTNPIREIFVHFQTLPVSKRKQLIWQAWFFVLPTQECPSFREHRRQRLSTPPVRVRFSRPWLLVQPSCLVICAAKATRLDLH